MLSTHSISIVITTITIIVSFTFIMVTVMTYLVNGPWHKYLSKVDHRLELRGFSPWQVYLTERKIKKLHAAYKLTINSSSLLRRKSWITMASLYSDNNLVVRTVRWECMQDFIMDLYLRNPDGKVRVYLDGIVAGDYICMNDFLANHRQLKDQVEYDKFAHLRQFTVSVGSSGGNVYVPSGIQISGTSITQDGTGITIGGGTP